MRFWHHQLQDLSSDYRLVAYDLRGHGRSARPTTSGDYSIAALAADLDAVLTTCVPAGEKVVVAGHSMGGMTLVAWAGAHPDQVSRRLGGALLIDTAMERLILKSHLIPDIPKLAVLRTIIGSFFLGFPAPLPAPPDPFLLHATRFVAFGPHARPAHIAHTAGMVHATRARVRANFGRTLARLDIARHLHHLTVPTTIVVGTNDVLTPPVQARAMHDAIPGSELVELPHAGHMAPIEVAPDVAAAIRAMAARAFPPG